MSRTAIAYLSTENLLHNLSVIKNQAKPAKVIAMVKANGYGHGIRSVGLRLDGQVDMMGVASIDEALTLRKVGVKSPLMLNQGVYEANELKIASAERFHVVFNNPSQLEWLDKTEPTAPLKSWIKVNTGLSRLGFNPQEAEGAYNQLQAHRHTEKPIRIMSHFSCADQANHPLNQQQISSFKAFIKDKPSEYSLCNSAAIWGFSDCHFNYVRPGIMLYGVSPFKEISATALGLKPVMTVKSTLISVQKHPKGASIGYGARYTLPEDMPVGIVTFGYGDGYPLTAQDGTPLLIHQTECPLIGRVSMDMMAVDLRPCPHAQVGDSVTLWGEGLPVERLAENSAAIAWNILASVQNRVKFVWSAA